MFVPTGYDEFASSAQSAVLGQIIQPWFYNQLRTEEQLGYAVFAFSMNVGRQWGLGFLLQSSDKQPAYLWHRYQAFFPQVEAKLRAMKPEEFAQIQQAVIAQVMQPPQTLGEEASQLSKDFDRGNLKFDSRDKVVAEIKQLTPQKAADFFHQAVIKPQGITILSQVSGSQNGKTDYVNPKGWKVWKSVSALQQSMPGRERMTDTAESLDPLRLPLQGERLIEASAGTGKTFTIAALYLRLLLGLGGNAAFPRPLSVEELLVVTFTEAATAELRGRIRPISTNCASPVCARARITLFTRAF